METSTAISMYFLMDAVSDRWREQPNIDIIEVL